MTFLHIDECFPHYLFLSLFIRRIGLPSLGYPGCSDGAKLEGRVEFQILVTTRNDGEELSVMVRERYSDSFGHLLMVLNQF